MLKINISNPPNIEQIKHTFPSADLSHAIYCYGDTLYNPNEGEIMDHVYVHELVHQLQQQDDPGFWWNCYLMDKDFRLDQEVEAYREQYFFLSKKIKDRNKLFTFLHKLSTDLSSPLYGSLVSYQEACRLIRNK